MIQVTEPEINRQLARSIHYFTSAKITTSSSTPSHKSSPLLGYYRGQEGLFSCGHPLGWPQDIRMLWQMMTKPQKNCDASIRKYWIKNPRKRLWSDLHNIRTIGMFVLSLIFLFVSCQPLFFYCRVTCSMWPKTCLPRSPQIYTIWIQYQRETGQLSSCFQAQIFRRKRLIEPAWVRHSFLDQWMWPGGQGIRYLFSERYLFTKHEFKHVERERLQE